MIYTEFFPGFLNLFNMEYFNGRTHITSLSPNHAPIEDNEELAPIGLTGPLISFDTVIISLDKKHKLSISVL